MRLAVAVLVATAVFNPAGSAGRAADAPAPSTAGPVTKPTTIERGAITGIRQRIAFLYQVNSGCHPEGLPAIHTLSPPQHGKLEAATDEKYPFFEAGSRLVECNLHPVSGTVLLYTSAPGFQGEDSVTLSIIYPDRARYVIRYHLTVESAG